jgi:hypothetical protein
MFFLIDILRRHIFLTMAGILIAGYTIANQFGMDVEFTKYVSDAINTYLPQIKPYIEEVKTFLNGLKL